MGDLMTTGRKRTSEERAPMCPICNNRHWAREPHQFKKKAKKKRGKR